MGLTSGLQQRNVYCVSLHGRWLVNRATPFSPAEIVSASLPLITDRLYTKYRPILHKLQRACICKEWHATKIRVKYNVNKYNNNFYFFLLFLIISYFLFPLFRISLLFILLIIFYTLGIEVSEGFGNRKIRNWKCNEWHLIRAVIMDKRIVE